jgi:hypothetical protein
MSDLRSSRFVRPFTRGASVFSRLRDQPRTSLDHRHGRSEPEAPLLASSGLSTKNPPADEPQWASADGHRCYPAVPAMPEVEVLSEAPWSISSTHPSVRPDLGTAGPDDDPGDDEDDDETPTNLTGPIAPTDDLAPWPIETPEDAIDTFELRRSSTFHSGLVILAMDRNRVSFLHVAFRGNPVDDIERALSLFSPSLPNGRVPSGLILGVIRSEHRQAPQSVLHARQAIGEPSIWVDPAESAAWRIAAWKLHDAGIRLHDVLVIEPDRWMSLAGAAGLVSYDTLEYA